MPLLSGRYTTSNGPLIQIGAEPAWTIARTPGRILQPVPADRVFTALIDSGATMMSCISASVVSALGIKPVGMRQMGSASQSSVATNTYVVDLAVVFPEYTWWFANMLVFEYTPTPNCGHQILLGRDILCQCAFTLHADGHFSLAI
jgi:Aspartyl protease